MKNESEGREQEASKEAIIRRMETLLENINEDLALDMNVHLSNYADHGYKLILFMLAGAGAALSIMFSNIDDIFYYIGRGCVENALIMMLASGFFGFCGIIFYLCLKEYCDPRDIGKRLLDKYNDEIDIIEQSGVDCCKPSNNTLIGYIIRNNIKRKQLRIGEILFPIDIKMARRFIPFAIFLFLQLLFFALYWLVLGLGFIR